MVIVVVECESCGQTFGIRPQDVRDRRSVHCIHCGKLVVMPKEDDHEERARTPQVNVVPFETAVDEAGNVLWERPYIFNRLDAPGQVLVDNGVYYEVKSSGIDRTIRPLRIRTVLRRLGSEDQIELIPVKTVGPVLMQLHHHFRDGHTEFVSQREIRQNGDTEAWLTEMKVSHPLPHGAQWLFCNEQSAYFVKTTVQGVTG